MTSWDEFAAAAPHTAVVFERRLKATGLGLLATTRADGFPRISPLEPLVHDGRLWFGMMPESTKSNDLRRDPRCCLHSATADKKVTDGDAKLWGRAVEATDADDFARYAAAFKDENDMDPSEIPGGFDLWWLDITGGSAVELASSGDHLDITVWRQGEAEQVVERY